MRKISIKVKTPSRTLTVSVPADITNQELGAARELLIEALRSLGAPHRDEVWSVK